MRISDWSSDVCSSDLALQILQRVHILQELRLAAQDEGAALAALAAAPACQPALDHPLGELVELCALLLQLLQHLLLGLLRTEGSRVGKACVRKCSSRCSPYH